MADMSSRRQCWLPGSGPEPGSQRDHTCRHRRGLTCSVAMSCRFMSCTNAFCVFVCVCIYLFDLVSYYVVWVQLWRLYWLNFLSYWSFAIVLSLYLSLELTNWVCPFERDDQVLLGFFHLPAGTSRRSSNRRVHLLIIVQLFLANTVCLVSLLCLLSIIQVRRLFAFVFGSCVSFVHSGWSWLGKWWQLALAPPSEAQVRD